MLARRAFLILVLTLPAAQAAVSATWHVERDGSGDFTIIQDAINAASTGDTISIGPGTYPEYAFGWFNGQWNIYSCGFVTKDNLTIVGAGPEQTVIGPPVLDLSRDLNGFGMTLYGTLTVRDLTLQHLSDGVFFSSSNLHVANCRVIDCNTGVYSSGRNSNIIEDCEFRDMLNVGVTMSWYTEGIRIIGCNFLGGPTSMGMVLQGASDAQVVDCLLQGQGLPISVDLNCRVQILRCRMIGDGYMGLRGHFGVSIDLIDSEIGPGQYGIMIDSARRFAGHGNLISGCSARTIYVLTTSEVEFHGNHIFPGGGTDIEARAMQLSCPEPCHYDFTDNYWGTTTAEEIANRIIDYTDFNGSDYQHWAIIDFLPFADQPVQTEPTTWGAVKALFK